MQLFKAISNSTIYDVCLNTYGSLDYLVKLMVDNKFVSVNEYPVNEQEFIFDETLVVDKSTKDLKIKYATQ
jgi:glycopeptide antibiotics resistance protein